MLLAALNWVGIAVGYIDLSKSPDANNPRAAARTGIFRIERLTQPGEELNVRTNVRTNTSHPEKSPTGWAQAITKFTKIRSEMIRSDHVHVHLGPTRAKNLWPVACVNYESEHLLEMTPRMLVSTRRDFL